MNSKIMIIAPLMPLLLDKFESEIYRNVLSDLRNYSKNTFQIYDIGSFTLEIEIVSLNEIKKYYPNSLRPKFAKTFLKFSGNALIEPKKIDNMYLVSNTEKKTIDYDSMIGIASAFFRELFKFQIRRLLIAASIANAGIVRMYDGIIIQENEYIGLAFKGVNGFINEARCDLIDLKWPPLEKIPLDTVVKWLEKNSITFDCNSKTAVERAIYAFTYISDENVSTPEAILLWSLMGLESLYCTQQSASKSEQLREKSQSYLGRAPNQASIMLKRLYKARSEFVHGKMNIRPSFYYEEQDIVRDLLLDSAFLGVLLLTSSMQKMIIEDRSNLLFNWSIQ
ncbi:hypothetical protein [Leptospira noguchii]|uniref:hypothetical protein n=1 Tax=Leptospira noguchii TaxID=28182 RepID=UPI000349E9D6|nr:hypothetical protein [Leptospira noguchii]